MNFFEGLHIKLDLKRYTNSVFFFKEDMFLMRYNWEHGYLLVEADVLLLQ